jgi:hypothetical protein
VHPKTAPPLPNLSKRLIYHQFHLKKIVKKPKALENTIGEPLGIGWWGINGGPGDKQKMLPIKTIEEYQQQTVSDDDDGASVDRMYEHDNHNNSSYGGEEDDEDSDGIPTETFGDDEGVQETHVQHQNNQPLAELSFKKAANMTLKDAEIKYNELVQRWMLDTATQMDDWERGMKLVKINFKNIDFSNIEEGQVEHEYTLLDCEIDSVSLVVHRYQKEFGVENAKILLRHLTTMKEQCFASYELLLAMFRQKTACKSGEIKHGYLKARSPDPQYDAKQEMLVKLYEKAAVRQYRKYRGKLYKPKYINQTVDRLNENGETVQVTLNFFTHCYVEDMDIADFVKHHCDRQLREKQWKFITQQRRTTRAILTDLTETLQLLGDHQLPDITRDRHKFAFRNGIYITKIIVLDEKTNRPKVTSRFYPYDSDIFSTLDSRKVAAKFFDAEFEEQPDDEDWATIPTGVLDRVLHYQFGHRDDYDEIYRSAFLDLGRMLFDRGDMDNWQYMVHWLGIAGTGKSIITEHCVKNFYEPANRVEIDNSIEMQFGLGGLVKDKIKDKQIFITLSGELDSHCQLQLPMALKMCDGSEITAAIKNGDPITFSYPSHWMAAENEYPAAWKDVNGNVLRRMKMYEMCRRVRKKDKITNLHELIQKEFPNIIQKAVKAYHYYVNKYGKFGSNAEMWSFCPNYFLQTQDNLANNANYLRSYIIESNKILLSPTLVVSEEDLYQDYKEYCKNKGWRADIKNKKIVYESMVQELNDNHDLSLEYRKCGQMEYEGKMQWTSQYYFFGLGLISRVSDEDRELMSARTPREDILAEEKSDHEEEHMLMPDDDDDDKGKEEEVN